MAAKEKRYPPFLFGSLPLHLTQQQVPLTVPPDHSLNLSPYSPSTLVPLSNIFCLNYTEAPPSPPPGVPAYTLPHLWNTFHAAFELIFEKCHPTMPSLCSEPSRSLPRHLHSVRTCLICVYFFGLGLQPALSWVFFAALLTVWNYFLLVV